MISVSANFATAITGTTREIRAYLDFNSGTIFRGADGLISIRFENSLMDEDRVSVGCACSSYVVCEWFNKLTGVSLANSYFDAYIGVVESYAQSKPVGSIEDDTAVVEYVKLGRFWITDIERGKATTKVTAYDAMSKASGEYSPTVTAGVNGYDVASIIADIETQCGISGTITGTAYVDKIYESTGREQLGWLCSVLYGDGSSFVIDRTTGDLTAVNFVKSVADGTIDDTTIYLDGVEDKPTFTIGSVEMGTDEATYTAGSGVGISRFNPYATQTIVDSIYADVDGMSFTPMKLHFRGDPRIEVGDLLSVTTDSNTYSVTVMKQTLTFNGGLECTLECFGDLEAHYIMSKSPTEAQFQRTNTVIAEMAEALENADNGIITTIKDADGYPTELLILNSMDKDTATSVWRWNINGLGHTNAYNGGTYNFALDDQGRINASMLIIGTITDQQGYNSWNLDTGAFTITNGSINIITSNKDVDSISLNYSTYSDDISPYSVKLTDTDPSINQRTVVNATGIKGYRGGNWTTPANTSMLLSAGGILELGGNGSNGTFTLKNSTGDTVAFWSGLTERLKLTDADGNGGILSLGGESLYFTNSSNNTLLNISPSNGMTIFDVGSIYRAEYSREYVRFRNASNKITAQLNTSSNNSYLMLGDGSTTYNRTYLDDTGLTFRDSSNVVTAYYPSYGIYAQDMGSRNLAKVTEGSFVRSGVTFTVGSDGSVSMSGTSSASDNPAIGEVTLKAGHKYYLSGANGGSSSLYLYFSSSTDGVCYDSGSGSTEYTATVDGTYTLRVYISASGVSTGKTFWPMVRESKITDTTYYPYAMTNRELTESVTALDATETSNVTAETGWTRAAGSYLYRRGNYVQMYYAVTGGTLTASSWNTIGRLPAGYYPHYNFNFPALDNAVDDAVQAHINGSTGVVQVFAKSGIHNDLRLYATWIL